MLQTVEQETGASPQWSVIWLHGLGADGHDFAPIVPELVRPHWPALRFVFRTHRCGRSRSTTACRCAAGMTSSAWTSARAPT